MLKLLTPSNQIKYIRVQRSSYYKIRLPNTIFFSRKQLYSQILESGITFASLSKNASFEYYLTQLKSMLDWKLIAKIDKDPKILTIIDYRLFRYSHPLIREYFDTYIDPFC